MKLIYFVSLAAAVALVLVPCLILVFGPGPSAPLDDLSTFLLLVIALGVIAVAAKPEVRT